MAGTLTPEAVARQLLALVAQAPLAFSSGSPEQVARMQAEHGREAVAARGVDVRDGRVDDGRLGRAPYLREVGEQRGEVEEAPVERLAALALDGIMGGAAFGGVSPARGFPLLAIAAGGRRVGRRREFVRWRPERESGRGRGQRLVGVVRGRRVGE